MSKIYDLTKGSIFKKIMAIALPILLTSISQMAYNLTDMYWIGQVDNIGVVEDNAISAIGTVGYILWMAFGFLLIAKIGTSVKVSHSAGEKNLDGIRKYASNGLILATVFGLLTSLAILSLRHPLISLFNMNNPEVYDYAIRYLTITGGLYFIQFITNGFTAINEGLGKSLINLLILPIGLIANMILDPFMILTLRMGVEGAAYATVISQALTLGVYIIVYLCSKQKVFTLKKSSFDLKVSKEIVKVGLPVGLQSMAFTLFSILIGIMVIKYGNPVFAAQRVGTQIEQFTWMISGGFQTALAVFVGQNFGAKNYERIRKGTILLSAILIPYSLVVMVIFIFQSEFLIRLFLDSEETIGFGTDYLRIISLSQPFMMIEGIGTGLFNGVGKTKVPSITGMVGNALRIPLSLFLSIGLAQYGIWWAMNISDGLKGGVLVVGGILLLVKLEKKKVLKGPSEEITQNVA